jgi:hypothetical protein
LVVAELFCGLNRLKPTIDAPSPYIALAIDQQAFNLVIGKIPVAILLMLIAFNRFAFEIECHQAAIFYPQPQFMLMIFLYSINR